MKSRLAIILLLLAAASQLAFYPFLPDEVVTKWDASGNPAFTMSKLAHTISGIIMPCFAAFLLLGISRATHSKSHQYMVWITSAFIVFLWLVEAAISLRALGYAIPIDRILIPALGLLLVLLGLFVPRMEVDANYQLQMQHEEIQKRFQQKSACILIIFGAVMAALAILAPSDDMDWMFLYVIGGMVVSLVGAAVYYLIQDGKA